jgi:hypothetical protein
MPSRTPISQIRLYRGDVPTFLDALGALDGEIFLGNLVPKLLAPLPGELLAHGRRL